MENNKKYETLMQELSNENDAIRQSVIIGRIIQDTADKTQQAADKAAERSHRIIKWLAWLLALSIAVNIIIVGAFLWYESQWEYETTTTTTTIEQDTGTGNGNNVYQSGESAQYHEGQKDGVNDGKAENNNSNNNNPQTQNQ